MSPEPSSSGPGPDARVHQWYEHHARRTPSAPAMVCGGQRLSYGELDRRANRLAWHLREAGLPPGGLVAVCLGRGPELLVAVLGVLKAGGAYVPLEPNAPEPVLRHVLADADPYTVVTEEAHRVKLSNGTPRTAICLDTEAGTIAGRPGEAGDAQIGADDLACVLYTSGTTGPPKGVLIEHGTLLSAFEAWRTVYRLSPEDRHLQTTALEFAGFTADWIRALCSGGALVMDGRNGAHGPADDIAALYELIVNESVTVMECDVATMGELHRHIAARGLDLGGVRLVSVTGDTWYLDEQQALRRALGAHVRIINVYGLTEAAGGGTYFELPDRPATVDHPEQVSLIGLSLPNLTVSVLDKAGRPVPRGTSGEVAIDGPGIARGYRGDPRLRDHSPVRTGDLGRIRGDGMLEHLGRLDSHADAEAVLRGHPSVRECLVADVETAPGRKTLIAYIVVADADADLDRAGDRGAVETAEIRAFLSSRLPSRRVPRAVVAVPSLPRTRSGRADRGGLPIPAQGSARGPSGGKAGGPLGSGGSPRGCGLAGAVLLLAFLAWALTDLIWPGSTDLSSVPAPWAALFAGLYLFENVSLGVGIVFLFAGRNSMKRQRRSPALTTAAHLAIVWLLVSWWPQDNFFRLAAKTDWPRQAALVYAFNIPLMIAAAVVAAFAVSRPKGP
jgi:amino acid adenylation domain-containing protein